MPVKVILVVYQSRGTLNLLLFFFFLLLLFFFSFWLDDAFLFLFVKPKEGQRKVSLFKMFCKIMFDTWSIFSLDARIKLREKLTNFSTSLFRLFFVFSSDWVCLFLSQTVNFLTWIWFEIRCWIISPEIFHGKRFDVSLFRVLTLQFV